MTRTNKSILALLFACILCLSTGFSQSLIPDNPGKWVVDEANVISPVFETTISNLCQEEFDSTSNQIVIYTVDYLQGLTIEQYANMVFNKWKIGSKEKNNGILFMVAVKSRKMRIEVGYGLESYITDLEAKQILDEEVQPYFKKGDFDHGILKGTEKIIYAISNSYEPSKSWYASNEFIIKMLVCILVCVGMALFLSRATILDAFVFNFFSNLLIFMAFFGKSKADSVFYIMGATYVGCIIISIVLRRIKKPRKTINILGSGSGGGRGSSGRSGGGSSGVGGGGGGFSGGGGSSGGGGASSSW